MENKTEECAHCGQSLRVYRRTIRYSMVKMLVGLHTSYRRGEVRAIQVPWYDGTGEFAKLRFWGLIQPGVKRSTWRITESGVAFIKGLLSVKKYKWIYNSNQVRDDCAVRNPSLFAYEIAPDVVNKETALLDSETVSVTQRELF